MRGILKHATLLTAAFGIMGCASTPNVPQTAVDVHIDNNLIPPSMITVYFVPEAGIERMIGTVVPATKKVLQYKGSGLWASTGWSRAARTTATLCRTWS
jgi:hypothetical protein